MIWIIVVVVQLLFSCWHLSVPSLKMNIFRRIRTTRKTVFRILLDVFPLTEKQKKNKKTAYYFSLISTYIFLNKKLKVN